MEGVFQLLGLVLYEAILAVALGAFYSMDRVKKKIYLVLALFPLTLMTMFHAANIGNDTMEYIQFFEQVKKLSLHDALQNARFEPGYILYNWILSRISGKPQILFIVTGLFTYWSLGRWLNKWSATPGMFVCLIVEMLTIDTWMSVQRQTIAMAVLFFAYDYLIERRLIKFVLLVLGAALFHKAAFVFLLAWPAAFWFRGKQNLFNKYQFEILVLVGCVIVSIVFEDVFRWLLKYFPQYSYYLGGSYADGKVRIAVVLKIIVYGFMLFLPHILKKTGKLEDNCNTTYVLYRFSLINLAFMVLANQATIMMRLAGIFSIFAVQEYTHSLTKLKVNKNILIMSSLVLFAVYGCVITVFRTPEWQTTYPFIWCWQ